MNECTILSHFSIIPFDAGSESYSKSASTLKELSVKKTEPLSLLPLPVLDDDEDVKTTGSC